MQTNPTTHAEIEQRLRDALGLDLEARMRRALGLDPTPGHIGPLPGSLERLEASTRRALGLDPSPRESFYGAACLNTNHTRRIA